MDLAGIGLSLIGAALRSTPAAHAQQHQRATKLALEHADKVIELVKKGDVRLAFQELEFTYQFLGVMRANDTFFKGGAKSIDRERVVLEKIVEAREKFLDLCQPSSKK